MAGKEVKYLLEVFDLVNNELRKNENVIIDFCVTTPPLDCNEVNTIEKQLPGGFPELLFKFYTSEAESLELAWKISSDVFGEKCNRGRISLISPRNILNKWHDMVSCVEDTSYEDVNEGVLLMRKDWPHWIPVVRFPNGDSFCLDTSSSSNPNDYLVRFMEHDVMDGGPFIHGIKIASCFKELVEKWAAISFVDVFDWSLITDENGLNLESDILKGILRA